MLRMTNQKAENDIRAELAALVAEGKIHACCPFDGMDDDWTEEEKASLRSALAQMFNWKDEK